MAKDPCSLLVEVCHLIAARGFTSATGGNISVRLADGTCWVTPSRLHKARVTVKDLVRVDARCRVVEGTRPASSEMLVHLAIYRALPQAMAVVHAHPPAATGFAQACRAIDTRSSSEASVILGPKVPLIAYERPSTPRLAEAVGRAMVGRQKAYLLAQHGAITWGTDLWDAYDILDTLEVFTQSLVVATIVGGAKPLPAKERAWLEGKFIKQSKT
jgi:L-fuculose-phosphate aldolase